MVFFRPVSVLVVFVTTFVGTVRAEEAGTVYLGGVHLTDLHRVRRVTEHTPGAVAAASTAFGWHRAPWCPDMF